MVLLADKPVGKVVICCKAQRGLSSNTSISNTPGGLLLPLANAYENNEACLRITPGSCPQSTTLLCLTENEDERDEEDRSVGVGCEYSISESMVLTATFSLLNGDVQSS